MYSEEIREPVTIDGIFGNVGISDSDSNVTIAAFFLVSGPLYIHGVAGESQDMVVPPDNELEIIGLRKPNHEQRREPRSFNYPNDLERRDVSDVYIGELVKDANDSRLADDVARAIAVAIHSPNELVRVCALGSAVEFYPIEQLDFVRQISWFYENATQEQTFQLLNILIERVLSRVPMPIDIVPAPMSFPKSTQTKGLMTVHGTRLFGRKSTWSIPSASKFYRFVSLVRPDIYSGDDYFHWKGGYSDRERTNAAVNLTSWIGQRSLSGIDVVAHSHGCNVVIQSIGMGAQFNKLLLMNCPVHWRKYNLADRETIERVVSLRIRFDFVILMDRGGQRFPTREQIREVVLPDWYTGHSNLTNPHPWYAESLWRHL